MGPRNREDWEPGLHPLPRVGGRGWGGTQGSHHSRRAFSLQLRRLYKRRVAKRPSAVQAQACVQVF